MRTATDLVSMRLAICYVLADLGAVNGIELRQEVEGFVGEDLDNQRIYEVLYRLRDEGWVSQEKENATRGRFQLTDDGRQRLEAHHEWASERLDDSTGQQTLDN